MPLHFSVPPTEEDNEDSDSSEDEEEYYHSELEAIEEQPVAFKVEKVNGQVICRSKC